MRLLPRAKKNEKNLFRAPPNRKSLRNGILRLCNQSVWTSQHLLVLVDCLVPARSSTRALGLSMTRPEHHTLGMRKQDHIIAKIASTRPQWMSHFACTPVLSETTNCKTD